MLEFLYKKILYINLFTTNTCFYRDGSTLLQGQLIVLTSMAVFPKLFSVATQKFRNDFIATHPPPPFFSLFSQKALKKLKYCYYQFQISYHQSRLEQCSMGSFITCAWQVTIFIEGCRVKGGRGWGFNNERFGIN